VSDLLFRHFAFLVDLMSDARHLLWAELLVGVESLRDAIDVLADFVRAPAGRREERLLSVRALIRATIEHSVRRGVAVALTMA
jgi:hypothetical protein